MRIGYQLLALRKEASKTKDFDSVDVFQKMLRTSLVEVGIYAESVTLKFPDGFDPTKLEDL